MASATFDIRHLTQYHHTQPVSLSYHISHLLPRTTERQECEFSKITISPNPRQQERSKDFFGNETLFFCIQEPYQKLAVSSMMRIRVSDPPAVAPASTVPWETVRSMVSQPNTNELIASNQFLYPSLYVLPLPELIAYAIKSFPTGRPILEAALDLTHRIHEDFAFDSHATTISTPLSEVLATRRGVCQDFAHLQVGCFRAMGLPSRYVSGYLDTDPPEGTEKLLGADASHAWVSLFCGKSGWIDFDPTNDVIPSHRHITLAWGRDYSDVSPLRGVTYGGGDHQLSVNVTVSRAKAEA